MRTLTTAEARVIAALLASGRVTERSRLDRAAVPRSTFHSARRRAYEEQWLKDRYIPSPPEFALPYAVLALVRPYADRFAGFVRERAASPATVHLAHGTSCALVVSWHPDEASQQAAVASAGAGGAVAWAFALAVDLRAPSVPVYFDFEGGFVHLTDLGAPEGYPQGLGGAGPDPKNSARSGDDLRRTWAVTELVHRAFPSENGRSPHLLGPLGLPWGQRRLLNVGWVQHRVLLDPARLPPFQGRAADQVVFVTGTLRSGARPESLFRTLTQEARVFPFLFAASEDRVLFGALGQGPGGTELPPPVTDRSRPVLRSVQERLEGIEILTEPARGFAAVVDHRYDRWFPRPTPPG